MIKALMVTRHMKQKQHNKKTIWRYRYGVLPVLVIALVLSLGATALPNVAADSIGDEIERLQKENAANRNTVAQLQDQAVSYQDAINRLQSQITLLQGQINDNLAKQAALRQQIIENQANLDRQRAILGSDIKAMYVDGQPSTLEMLASSGSLGDFVDKEQYRTNVQTKIQETLKKINQLQAELKKQKQAVDQLLQDLQLQRGQLDAARAQQSQLLAYNQSQQAEYNNKTKANQSRIADLVAQQLRVNNATPDGGYYFLRFPGGANSFDPGSYPYRNWGFSMSTAPGCNDNDGPDKWGYCTRQCVSYAAWAVEASGRSAPRYYGNARDWVSAAYHSGIPVYRDPQPGDVAISTAGTWGHAMYVEKVDGNQIFVSQYNQQLTGQFSYQWRTYR